MNVNKWISFLAVLVLMLSVPLAAQEAPKTEKIPFDISGLFYMQWAQEVKNNESSVNPNRSNSFSLQRAYLDFSKALDESWSARFTSDVENYVNGDGKTRYSLYVKYAYGELKQAFGPVDAKIRFGLIPTPVVGLTDKLSDARWIYNNYFDKSSDLIAPSIDYSADIGLSLEMAMVKMVTVTLMAANGDGYRDTREEDRSHDPTMPGYQNAGKAYYGMVTVNPMEGLFVSGFGRYQVTNDNVTRNYLLYYGAGVAYSVSMIKAGVNLALPQKSVRPDGGSATTSKYQLIDSWVNVNLASVVNMPLLLYGRFAMGRDKDVKDNDTMIAGGGAGYEVNKFFRVLAYFDHKKVKGLKDPDQTFYVKSEVKF